MEKNRNSMAQEVTAINAAARPSLGSSGTASIPAKDKLVTRFLRWLYPDQRKTPRHSYPPIVSYLGVAHATRSYQVADISASGFFMITVDRWLHGTQMPVTLERTDLGGTGFGKSITLLSTAVRSGPTGVGFSFVLPDAEAQGVLESFIEGLKLNEYNAGDLERAS